MGTQCGLGSFLPAVRLGLIDRFRHDRFTHRCLERCAQQRRWHPSCSSPPWRSCGLSAAGHQRQQQPRWHRATSPTPHLCISSTIITSSRHLAAPDHHCQRHAAPQPPPHAAPSTPSPSAPTPSRQHRPHPPPHLNPPRRKAGSLARAALSPQSCRRLSLCCCRLSRPRRRQGKLSGPAPSTTQQSRPSMTH
jgi:hypothetical protein